MAYSKKIIFVISLFLIFSLPVYAGSGKGFRLATSTSLKSSGLQDVIVKAFESETAYQVEITAAGSGKSLQLGMVGDADLVWTHSPESEDKFVKLGFGLERHLTMYNDFIVVGPSDDPAAISKEKDILVVFKKIAFKKALFLSRADDSGTDRREKRLWKDASIEPYGDWFYEAGLGMGDALKMANRKGAYILVDRSTWLAKREPQAIKLLFEGDNRLVNYYSLIAINPQKHPSVNAKGASAFIKFVTAEKGHDLIRNFRVKGEQLFIPVKH